MMMKLMLIVMVSWAMHVQYLLTVMSVVWGMTGLSCDNPSGPTRARDRECCLAPVRNQGGSRRDTTVQSEEEASKRGE